MAYKLNKIFKQKEINKNHKKIIGLNKKNFVEKSLAKLQINITNNFWHISIEEKEEDKIKRKIIQTCKNKFFL